MPQFCNTMQKRQNLRRFMYLEIQQTQTSAQNRLTDTTTTFLSACWEQLRGKQWQATKRTHPGISPHSCSTNSFATTSSYNSCPRVQDACVVRKLSKAEQLEVDWPSDISGQSTGNYPFPFSSHGTFPSQPTFSPWFGQNFAMIMIAAQPTTSNLAPGKFYVKT